MTTTTNPIIEPAYSERLPLRISRGVAGNPSGYSVVLGHTELTRHLAAEGGVKIEFGDRGDGQPEPVVTLTFGPAATQLELDTELIAYLRAVDEANGEAKSVGGPTPVDTPAPKDKVCEPCTEDDHEGCTLSVLNDDDVMVLCSCSGNDHLPT